MPRQTDGFSPTGPLRGSGAAAQGPPDETTSASADREWVRAAVRRYERPLVAYAAHITGRLDAARDVVQETFVRLCAADRADVEGRLAAWLFTVTRNGAIDYRRKERRMRLAQDDPVDVIPADGAAPDHAAEQDDALSAVLRALALLPAVQQEAVRLKFQHGLSYKEIGAVLDLTPTNVGFILHTALKALRTQFNDTPNLRLRA